MRSALGAIPGVKEKLKTLERSNRSRNTQPEVIYLPYIDFHTQRQLYEEWIALYNENIRHIRHERKKLGYHPKYQLIKSAHLNFIHEVTRCIIEQLREENKTWAYEGGVRLNPNAPYTLWINNTKLAARQNHSSYRTVWNHIQRLLDLNFILEKRFHGTRSDFELDINPEFLLFFDLADEKKFPKSTIGGITKEWGIPKGYRQKRQPYQYIIPTLNKRLKHYEAQKLKADGSSSRTQLTEAKSSKNALDSKKNAPREVKTIQERLDALCSHPGLKEPGPFIKFQNKEAPRHPLEEQIRPMVQQFLWMAHNKLWRNSNVKSSEYQKSMEYILERYFTKTLTMKGVRQRIALMEHIIDQQAEFVANEPKRFTMYPVQFFNMERELNDGDYSGFKGLWRLTIEKERKKQVSGQLKKQWRDKKQFKKAVDQWLDNPTLGGFKALEKKVNKFWPQHRYDLRMILMAQREILNLSRSQEK